MTGKRFPSLAQREKAEDMALLAVDAMGITAISISTIILYLKAFSPKIYASLSSKFFITLNKLTKISMQVSNW